jgi:hypothetical protein
LCRCCFILERDPCTLLPLCCISRLVPPLHMISVLPFFWKELVYGFGGSCLLLAAGLERSMCFSCFNYTRTACLGLERTCVGCLALGTGDQRVWKEFVLVLLVAALHVFWSNINALFFGAADFPKGDPSPILTCFRK